MGPTASVIWGAHEPESNATGARDGNRVWGALCVRTYMYKYPRIHIPVHTHAQSRAHMRGPLAVLAVPHATLASRFSPRGGVGVESQRSEYYLSRAQG